MVYFKGSRVWSVGQKSLRRFRQAFEVGFGFIQALVFDFVCQLDQSLWGFEMVLRGPHRGVKGFEV